MSGWGNSGNGGSTGFSSGVGGNNSEGKTNFQADDQTLKQFSVMCAGVYELKTEIRTKADAALRDLANSVDKQPGVVSAMMQLACNNNFPEDIRFQAATFTRRVIRSSWDPEVAEHCVVENEKKFIRAHVIEALMSAPKAQRNTWSESIRLIAEFDFPRRWPELLQGICNYLGGDNNLETMAGALQIAHSVFGRYRDADELTEELKKELMPINADFTLPLLHTAQQLVHHLPNHPDTKDIVIALTNAINCYGDMTCLDMGQEHEDNLDGFMHVLQAGLRYRNPHLVGTDYEPGPVTLMHVSVVDCVTSHLTLYDEEFDGYVAGFTEDIWSLLQERTTSMAAADDLAIQCMQYIGGVCCCPHGKMLSENNMTQQLCQQVILPCLHLRDDVEVELFFEEAKQYIEREIEGSDVHTRRRAAIDLARTLEMYHPLQAKPILQTECMNLLKGDWRAKDAAVCLIVALAIKGGSTTKTAQLELNNDVPIASFFDEHIMAELQNTQTTDKNRFILSADAIRFVATFRSFLSADQCVSLTETLAGWLSHPNEVVHTYAAHAIEKLILVKEDNSPSLRVSTEVFGKVAEGIVSTLCQRLTDRTGGANEYMMKCLMVIVKNHGPAVSQWVAPIMQALSTILSVQVKAPEHPVFSHCMWECISLSLTLGKQYIEDIENLLWPSIGIIFSEDVTAYLPYAMQIVGQLIDTRGEVGKTDFSRYTNLYSAFIDDNMFEYRGNIPAVTRVIGAFNRHCSRIIEENGQTIQTLNVYQRLINLKQFDHEGFNVLAAMVIHCPSEIIDKHMTSALQVIFDRQQSHSSPKFQRCEVFMFALITAHRGASYFYDLVEHIQQGLITQVLTKVWIPHQQKVLGVIERKVCVVALTNLAFDTPVATNTQLLGKCLQCLVRLIHDKIETEGANLFMPKALNLNDLSVGMDADEGSSSMQFNNQFVQLDGARVAAEDPCREVDNSQNYFENRCQEMLNGANSQSYRTAAMNLPQNMLSYVPK